MTETRCLGLDTSNYTTSAAVFDGEYMEKAGKLLPVPEGALGLRQSEALFQHLRQLPDIFSALEDTDALGNIDAVGASTQPRRVEGSYMPCFLPGETLGRCIASSFQVPFFSFSHQEGHLAAAAWSAGRPDLLDSPFLAWHLSGGTTEILYVRPEGSEIRAEKIGGTKDLSAGQLLDRTGKLLGIPFPAGAELDRMCGELPVEDYYRVKCSGLEFSLSGIENQVQDRAGRGEPPEKIACFALDTITYAVKTVTRSALEKYPGLPVLCCGGVAASRRLRSQMEENEYAAAEFSSDNAAGIAILAYRKLEEKF